ncbi:hypothetical protein [Parasitella parasitica]|uniref:Reverse transcriptase domain-containing protein n=1 Tax=Parasitella parasitica TaxID=35722 RepID=A0A0B7NM93_9FUNG|nr:hypothetical protein [Parasitella parasitica]
MPFGLNSAPATFQAFVNDIRRDFLDVFLAVYLDDYLIYSKSPEEHTKHVRMVLQRLREAKLSLKLEKCEFDVTKVQFLGFQITPQGISMDPEKIKAISEWSAPKNVHELQVFLGFANFYRRFIKDYSKLCTPLTSLLKKNAVFAWTDATESTFNNIKKRISSDPILRHYNSDLPCIIETDASDVALGAVCSQLDADAQENQAKYYNRKVSPGPTYNVGDKVWLFSKNIKTQRPTAKLDYRRLGPYTIQEKIGSRSYRLELPHTMKIHPVFHMNLLKPFVKDTIPGRTPKELPPVIIDDHEEYEVDYIVDSRIHRQKI